MTRIGADGNRTLTARGRALIAPWLKCPIGPNHPRRCISRNEQEMARVADSLAWTWAPHGCRLYHNSTDAPDTLADLPALLLKRGTRLRFFGDSINDDWALGMRCSASDLRSSELVHSTRFDNLGVLKKSGHRVRFDANNSLDAIEDRWRSKLASSGGLLASDTMVLDAGAHWTGTAEDAFKAYRLVAQALWRLQPRTVIYRTTVMGHNRCENFTQPFARAILTPALRKELSRLYNWNNFTALNEAIAAAFREVWPPGRFHVVNVSMFELRGDGHASPPHDCLHYCVPSAATEWWGRLLVHVLARSERGERESEREKRQY